MKTDTRNFRNNQNSAYQMGYIAIGLKKIKNDKVYLNNSINNGGNRLSNYAKKDAGILIEKTIPYGAIKSVHK